MFVATGFGIGLLPGAPGTCGALFGAGIWWLVLAQAPLAVQLASAGALIVAGTWLLRRLCARHALGDDPAIVLDEMAGVCLTLACLPSDVLAMTAGFVLFRLFDILKPWPVSWADRNVRGGLGVMLDDVLAGVLAAITGHLALWLLGAAG
ncbi:MAG: phosphatidylglycerophosphatase A [Gammaproteobacteria bacterium]|nr:phosphatidylglycerophosphatase A [Gammaproteobacteria bacterium]